MSDLAATVGRVTAGGGVRRAGGLLRHEAAVTGLVGLTAGLLIMIRVLGGLGSRKIAGNSHDIDLYTWWLEHTAWAVSHGHSPFVTTRMNLPVGVSAMWNTSVLLPGLVMAPVTLLFGSLASYNVLVLLAFGASATTAHLLLRRFTERTAAARAGALVWAFCPATIGSEQGHLALVLTPLVPLILLVLDELVRGARPALELGCALGLLAAAQLLSGEELLFETGVLSVVLLVVGGLSAPGRVPAAALRLARAAGPAIAVFAVTVGYPLAQQFTGPLKQHGSAFLTPVYETDVKSLLAPSSQYLISSTSQGRFAASFGGGAPEYLGYVSLPMVLLLVIAAVKLRGCRPLVVASVSAVVLIVASFGSDLLYGGKRPGIPLPWDLVSKLPVIENALPDRLMLVADLCLALALAIAVDRVILPAAGALRAAATGIFLVMVVSLLPHTFGAEQVADSPAYFTDGSIPRGTRALVLPYADPSHTEAMRWQAASGMRFSMPGGYFIGPDAAAGGQAYLSGPGPNAFASLLIGIDDSGGAPLVNTATRALVASDLQGWGVSEVVLGPSPNEASLSAAITSFLGGPVAVGGVLVWSVSPS